jgi:sarcosine oxidase, subunit gamma
MAEIARRVPLALAPGSIWRAAQPLTRYSLRVDLQSAAARVASVAPVATIPCHVNVSGDWHALWLGPDEQLLIGPDQAGPDFAAALSGALRDLPHSLVDVSHRQGAIEVTGPRAPALLNAGCPLDLGLRQFPPGYCTRTVMAKAEIVLWRRAADRFHLEVWRSFIAYLAGFMTQVEQEFGD